MFKTTRVGAATIALLTIYSINRGEAMLGEEEQGGRRPLNTSEWLLHTLANAAVTSPTYVHPGEKMSMGGEQSARPVAAGDQPPPSGSKRRPSVAGQKRHKNDTDSLQILAAEKAAGAPPRKRRASRAQVKLPLAEFWRLITGATPHHQALRQSLVVRSIEGLNQLKEKEGYLQLDGEHYTNRSVAFSGLVLVYNALIYKDAEEVKFESHLCPHGGEACQAAGDGRSKDLRKAITQSIGRVCANSWKNAEIFSERVDIQSRGLWQQLGDLLRQDSVDVRQIFATEFQRHGWTAEEIATIMVRSPESETSEISASAQTSMPTPATPDLGAQPALTQPFTTVPLPVLPAAPPLHTPLPFPEFKAALSPQSAYRALTQYPVPLATPAYMMPADQRMSAPAPMGPPAPEMRPPMSLRPPSPVHVPLLRPTTVFSHQDVARFASNALMQSYRQPGRLHTTPGVVPSFPMLMIVLMVKDPSLPDVLLSAPLKTSETAAPLSWSPAPTYRAPELPPLPPQYGVTYAAPVVVGGQGNQVTVVQHTGGYMPTYLGGYSLSHYR